MSEKTAEQLGDALASAIHSQDGKKLSQLTEDVKVIDSNGNETGQTKPRFILKPSAYLDIKAYIAAGLAFPATAEDFHTLHPKENLKKLTELDATIYEDTQLAMAGIHKSSSDFNTTALPNFRRITNEAKQYANTAILQLTGFGKGSFQGLLKLLTDNKYSKPGSEDTDEFRGASQAASMILLNLGEESLKKAQTIEDLSKTITSYLTTLKTDKDRIDGINQRYSGKSTTLTTGLEKLRADIKKAVEDANEADAKYKSDKATADNAVYYIWVPIAGWIAGTTVLMVHNKRAQEAHDKYEAAKKTQAEKETEKLYMERLIVDVELLDSQNKNIAKLMDSAKTALEGIRKIFEGIGNDLKEASSLMGNADSLLRGGLWVRQNMLVDRVNEAVADWRKVVTAADDFLDAEASVLGITDSVVPPKVG
ncbi:hypothetical protein NW762_003285 [Fusarium torreyae]|uniref:Uncharacterized protein n=1 Tax=Fusarium torreyae TaxID=1237075 RepID=A0A9W8VLI0_9HYPO|nr:hypothetical protein NW762_003285 [Fusarium torreyae]